MKIYKDYTTLNLLFNEPCNIDDKCAIYPISVKEYEEFMKYAKYINLSREQLDLKNGESLLQSFILFFVADKTEGDLDFTKDKVLEAMSIILNDVCRLFSILTKENIKCEASKNGGFVFLGDTTVINDNNYENIRKVVMKMTLMREPKIFKDKLAQKWYNKALMAKQQNQPKIELEDIIIMVSQDLKISFKDIIDMNIFQLYSYYYRIINRDNYDKLMNFKLVSDKVPNASFSNSIIEMLYSNDDSDLYIDGNSLSKMVK